MSISELLQQIDPLVSVGRRLKPICLTLMEYLLIHGPSTMYRAKEGTSASQGSTIKCFKSLSSIGLITEKTREPWRNRRDRVTHELTLRGFTYTYPRIQNNVNLSKVYNGKTIIGRFEPLLPLIFGKWSHYRDKGVEESAKNQLLHIPVSDNLNEIYETFFLSFKDTDTEFQQQWWNALREDPEIRQFSLTQLKNRLKKIDKNRRNTQTLIEVLEN